MIEDFIMYFSIAFVSVLVGFWLGYRYGLRMQQAAVQDLQGALARLQSAVKK